MSNIDIKRLEEKLKISRDNIYEKFFNKEFFCYMTGFIAGMPFLGDLDKNIRFFICLNHLNISSYNVHSLVHLSFKVTLKN